MRTSHQTILSNVKEQLEKQRTKIKDPALFAEAATQLIKAAIQEINVLIIIEGFPSIEDEIHFFKVERPQILYLFFYYNCVYKLETFKPKHGKKEIKEYLMNKKVVLKLFSDDNHEFYKYYQSGSTRFDSIYFVRGKFDIKTSMTSMYLMVDDRFCTYHCYLTAKILANQMFSEYIDTRLLKLKESSSILHVENLKIPMKETLIWTGSKTELIELIYALVADKAFNNGDASLKEVVKMFEELFNIDLGQYASTFIDIKKRKTGKTKFLDTLKEKLLLSFEDD